MPDLIFDAQLHADGLSDADVRSLVRFGLRAALVPSEGPSGTRSVRDFVAHFDDLVQVQAQRLWRLGVRVFAALGVHPSRIPVHGLEQVLAEIPRRLAGGTVVALGELGLERATRTEEHALFRQLELALELRVPVLLHTPERDKAQVTRRLLAIVRESGIAPERVLVDHVDMATLRLARECGHFAGLTVHPDRLSAEAAARLVQRYGAEGLVLSSDAGDGAGDIFSLARAASVLEEAGLSTKVVRRVLGRNAMSFYGIEASALTAAPAKVRSSR